MVIVRIWEGLGNQMFQYAYARALKERGINVKIDLNKAYDGIFEKYKGHTPRINSVQNLNISLPVIDLYRYKKYDFLYQNTTIKKIIYYLATHYLWKYKFYEESDQSFSEKLKNIKGNYYIKGWFQDERYFKGIRPILLKEFVPCKKIKIPMELKQALEEAESVSIHVRRGDYVKINRSLNSAYYKKAINFIKNVYINPIFIIFSDDLEWVKKNLQIDARCILVNENNQLQDYEELFIMSRCKSNIISNSTFSWWGAWLNRNKDKIVIAPRNWLKAQEDILPKKWKIL